MHGAIRSTASQGRQAESITKTHHVQREIFGLRNQQSRYNADSLPNTRSYPPLSRFTISFLLPLPFPLSLSIRDIIRVRSIHHRHRSKFPNTRSQTVESKDGRAIRVRSGGDGFGSRLGLGSTLNGGGGMEWVMGTMGILRGCVGLAGVVGSEEGVGTGLDVSEEGRSRGKVWVWAGGAVYSVGFDKDMGANAGMAVGTSFSCEIIDWAGGLGWATGSFPLPSNLPSRISLTALATSSISLPLTISPISTFLSNFATALTHASPRGIMNALRVRYDPAMKVIVMDEPRRNAEESG